MGTPDPAAKCLKTLIEAGENITAVFTQPDRPKGRGLKLTPSPVKNVAELNKIEVHTPEKIKDKDVIDLVRILSPDIIIIVAYGKILPKEILTIPKYGTINVHASLLPKYRGAAPVQWSILNGDADTGVTIMKVIEKLDAGDIISQASVPILQNDNTATLTDKIFNLGAGLLVRSVSEIKSGKVKYTAQDERLVSYAPALQKEMGAIDWKKSSKDICNQIRGLNPWPVAYTYYNGKILRIFSVEIALAAEKKGPGTVIDISEKGFTVATGDGAVSIREVQIESGKKMRTDKFLAGHKMKIGDVLPN